MNSVRLCESLILRSDVQIDRGHLHPLATVRISTVRAG